MTRDRIRRRSPGLPLALGVRLALCALLLPIPAWPIPARSAEIVAARTDLARLHNEIAAQETVARNHEHEAARLAEELALVRGELIAAARSAQEREAEATRTEREQAELTSRAAAQRQALERHGAELSGSLMALTRLARRPAYAGLLRPGDPTTLLRSGLVLRATLPAVEAGAARLRADIESAALLERSLAERRAAAIEAARHLERERARLAELAARKQMLAGDARAAQVGANARIEELVREARDLADLVERLERFDQERRERDAETAAAAEAEAAARAAEAARERAAAETPDGQRRRVAAVRALPSLVPPAARHTPAPISQAQGALAPPAEGQVLIGYGESTGFGSTSKGVTFATRPGAQVVAPFAGRVAFAGPFRQFGPILIIEHGEGYHSLLAGLARIDATVGQWVLTGEPVGVTGEAVEDAKNGRGNEARAAAAPTLYVELRRKGQPIDPLPWLAGSNDKGRG